MEADRADRDRLLQGFVPVNQRNWYPFEMPDGKWWEYHTEKYPEVATEKFNEVKKFALEDFFFFCDNIMRDPFFPHLDKELHGEMAYICQTQEDYLMLVPRYHLKSTIGTVYYTTWRLARDVNTRVLIKAATEQVSEAFLSEIKDNIQGNKLLNFYFPYLRPARGKGTREYDDWNKGEIKVDRTRIFKDPSVMAVGAVTNVTGMRFDLNINDDLMAEENSKSEKMINAIIEGFDKSRLLLAPGGEVSTIGTRKKDGDLYGYMIETLKVPLYKRSAIEDNKFIWNNPQVIKKIQKDKENMNPYTFSCEMMNDPISEETSEFRADYRKRWTADVVRNELMENPPENINNLLESWYKTLNIYIGCDPARSKNNRSNYTVILVLGSDKRGREYLLKCHREKLESMEIVDKYSSIVEDWYKNYHVDRFGIETEGGDIHLLEPIKRELKKRNVPISRLVEFKRKRTEDKAEHIRCLQLPWERGLIWLNDKEGSDCETEFLRFPYGRTDDVIDVWAHMHREFIKPKKEKREIAKDVFGYKERLLKKSSGYNWKVTY